jgi:hypothetical protein
VDEGTIRNDLAAESPQMGKIIQPKTTEDVPTVWNFPHPWTPSAKFSAWLKPYVAATPRQITSSTQSRREKQRRRRAGLVKRREHAGEKETKPAVEQEMSSEEEAEKSWQQATPKPGLDLSASTNPHEEIARLKAQIAKLEAIVEQQGVRIAEIGLTNRVQGCAQLRDHRT